jgi:hypothetical protein
MIKRFVLDTRETWKDFRKGLITASQINRIAAEGKNGNISQGSETYVYELIEAIEAEETPDFYSNAMEWGNEQEPQAVLRFCQEMGFDVNSDDVIYTSIGGFIFFTYKDIAGGTPDIILPRMKASVEIKCPDSKTHLKYKLTLTAENFQKELPKYYDQMQFNTFLTNSEKAYFVSFDPRVKKEKHQYFCLEIPRDEERIEHLLNKIELTNNFKKELLNKLNNDSN